ncbi:MAG: sigma-70 family RNA polymerase sigma factor [Victivallales bacterium]
MGYNTFKTSETLIRTLKTGDDKAWAVFYESYAQIIISFARKRGCSKELAEDVLQETTMVLMRYLKNFEYDRNKGRFKSLLFKITDSKIVDAFRRCGKISKLESSELFNKTSAPNGEPYLVERESLWDREWKERILHESFLEAKRRVKPMTFKCFEELYLKEKPVGEIAREMKISPNLISQHKFKVLKIITETAKKIIDEHGKYG